MHGGPAEAGAARRFALLAAALAVAVVLDQLWWGGFELASRHGLLVLAALVVLARPSSVGRFALLLAAEVVSVAADLPVVGSHRLLGLVVAATMLGRLTLMTVRSGRLPPPAAVFVAVAPFLRAAVIVLYLAAALAKLNTTFLDPATSCAVPSARGLPGAELLPGPWLAGIAIVGTLAAEAGLPVLLAWPRTRRAGVVLGLGFHAVLAVAGNVPFSALAGALYVAFLPAGVVLRPLGFRTPPALVRWGLVGLLAAGWLVGAAVGPSGSAPGLTAPPSALVVPVLGRALQVVTVALLLGGAAAVLVPGSRRSPGSAGSGEPARRGRPWRHPVLVAGVLVLVVNAACPYVGLKTDTSFEMFSGLRTEPGAWNHVLVPESVRFLGYQDRAVQVIAATEPGLVARTAGGARLLPVELDRALRVRPGSTALVRSDGEPTARTVGPRPSGRTLGEWAATFRDLLPPGVPRC